MVGMNAPIIGVTSAELTPITRNDKEAYTRAVEMAGGSPELIPADLALEALDALIARLDGILLTGGGDIDPTRFNGTPHPRVYGISESRDATEIELALRARDLRIPIFGICRGCQVMNVAYGGSLYTHILDQLPGALEHSHEKFREEHHFVNIDPDSLLECITGSNELVVNSLHHQGISTVAPALIPTACAPDGLVEGVELRGHPFGLGVQWHPEHLTDRGEMAALFEALVEAAGKYHDRAR
jgi:putative glutamine amidotransferase